MKKKLFMLLAFVMATMTASASAGFDLKVGTNEHGTITFKVGNQTVNTANEGDLVIVKITPEDGYAASAVGVKAVADWSIAKARTLGLDILNDIQAERSAINEYTFKMPASNVMVNVEYEFSAPVTSEEDNDEGEEVDDVTVGLEIVPGTAPTVEDGVTVVQVVITHVDLPKQTDATASNKKEITVEFPAVLTSANGKMKFMVTKITKDAIKTPEESNTIVTKVVLPETDDVIPIEEGAMSPNGYPIDVVTTLDMLDNYSLMESLKDNFEANKISAFVTPLNRLWTFSSGVDCVLPKGVSAYIVYLDKNTPRFLALSENDLKLADGRRGIKANNGVLIACDNEKGGNAYEIVASPGNQQSGTVPATTNAKSYKGNELVPTIVATNYAGGSYMVLKDNKFHSIKVSDSKVKPCKAVLPIK